MNNENVQYKTQIENTFEEYCIKYGFLESNIIKVLLNKFNNDLINSDYELMKNIINELFSLMIREAFDGVEPGWNIYYYELLNITRTQLHNRRDDIISIIKNKINSITTIHKPLLFQLNRLGEIINLEESKMDNNNKIEMNSIISGDIRLTDYIYDKKEYYGVHILSKSKKGNNKLDIKDWYNIGKKCKPEITQLSNLLENENDYVKLGSLRSNIKKDGFIFDCMKCLMSAPFDENSSFNGYNLSEYITPNFEKSLELTFLYLVNTKLIEHDAYILAEVDDDEKVVQFYFMINYLSDFDNGVIIIDLE